MPCVLQWKKCHTGDINTLSKPENHLKQITICCEREAETRLSDHNARGRVPAQPLTESVRCSRS